MDNYLLQKSVSLSFLVNFLAVVMGVAITFIGESMISSQVESRRAREILTLMRDELSGDVEGLEGYSDSCKAQAYAIDYLISHSDDVKSIPDDSLLVYGHLASSPLIIVMNNIAAELLHGDDFQNGVKDNRLKLSIAEAYVLLDGAVETHNLHTQGILDAIKRVQNEEFRRKACSLDPSSRKYLEEFFFSPEGLFMLKQIRGTYVCDAIASANARVREVIEEIDSVIGE